MKNKHMAIGSHFCIFLLVFSCSVVRGLITLYTFHLSVLGGGSISCLIFDALLNLGL